MLITVEPPCDQPSTSACAGSTSGPAAKYTGAAQASLVRSFHDWIGHSFISQIGRKPRGRKPRGRKLPSVSAANPQRAKRSGRSR